MNPYLKNDYFEQMILSASPMELIRLLYQRAISSARDAREHLSKGRVVERTRCINNACAVLMELTGSLRHEDAPDLSNRLSGLYNYMIGRLVDANMRKADEPLAEVLGLLSTLSEAWNAVSDTDTQPDSSMMPPCGSNTSTRFALSA